MSEQNSEQPAPAAKAFGDLCRQLSRRLAGQKLSNALLKAMTRGDISRVKRLLWLGASPDAPTCEGHARALNLIAMVPDDTLGCAMARLLIHAGANPNGPDRLGAAPLHLSAQFGLIGLTATLLRAGADPESLNGQGQTPIQAMDAFLERTKPTNNPGAASRSGAHQTIKTMIEAAERIALSAASGPARAPSPKASRI